MARVVASSTTAPGWRIALIVLGIAMTPVLLASSSLGSRLALADAIQAILLGSLILAAIACVTCSIGTQARMNTYQLVRFAFGVQGARAINALLAVSLLGWICVTANGFGIALRDLLAYNGIHLPLLLLVSLGCVIFVGATAFGFEVLSKVALYAIPVISLLLLYNLSQVNVNVTRPPLVPGQGMSMGVAISTVVGTFMVLVATLPDFGSFVHNKRQAVIGALLALALAYPLLYIAGAIPATLTGKASLIEAMTVFNSVIPALLLMLFATVTGNAGNMFQGTLVTSTLLPELRKPLITVLLGIVAAIIGSSNVTSWFIPFLLFLGITTPPVAGIYIADFVLHRRAGYDEAHLEQVPAVRITAFIAWLLASLLGGLSSRGMLTLTSIPSLDALLLAAALYALLDSLLTNKG
ncbi:cytosine permease [Neisseriaceae bacterium TC5R-5]|nr:cytosine permease [Neisseriaceae bacterium TC5R-5]